MPLTDLPPLLRGEETISLRRDSKKRGAAKQARTPLPDDLDVGLWEALRDCRREFAEAQGVPPYVVFHDRTLKEMCALMPRSLSAMAAIGGIGERKLDKYGPGFLAVIDKHLAGTSS